MAGSQTRGRELNFGTRIDYILACSALAGCDGRGAAPPPTAPPATAPIDDAHAAALDLGADADLPPLVIDLGGAGLAAHGVPDNAPDTVGMFLWCDIRPDVMGSDHCPVVADFDPAVLGLALSGAGGVGADGGPVRPPPLSTAHMEEYAGRQTNITTFFGGRVTGPPGGDAKVPATASIQPPVVETSRMTVREEMAGRTTRATKVKSASSSRQRQRGIAHFLTWAATGDSADNPVTIDDDDDDEGGGDEGGGGGGGGIGVATTPADATSTLPAVAADLTKFDLGGATLVLTRGGPGGSGGSAAAKAETEAQAAARAAAVKSQWGSLLDGKPKVPDCRCGIPSHLLRAKQGTRWVI